MLKRNSLMMIISVMLICGAAFAAGYGKIKVIVPLNDCKVYIDGIKLEPDEDNTVTTKLSEGSHSLSVRLRENTPIYETDVDVVAQETTIVNVPNELKTSLESPDYGKTNGQAAQSTPAAPSESSRLTTAQPQQQATQTQQAAEVTSPRSESTNRASTSPQMKKARWGITGNFSSVGAYTFYSGLGGMFGLGAFYSDVLTPDLRYELSGSYYAGSGNLNASGLTFIPFEFNVKYRLNDNITIGGGPRMTIVSFSWLGTTVSGSMLSYQINCEIASISSEIGMSSYDFYYKYKFYF